MIKLKNAIEFILYFTHFFRSHCIRSKNLEKPLSTFVTKPIRHEPLPHFLSWFFSFFGYFQTIVSVEMTRCTVYAYKSLLLIGSKCHRLNNIPIYFVHIILYIFLTLKVGCVFGTQGRMGDGEDAFARGGIMESKGSQVWVKTWHAWNTLKFKTIWNLNKCA